MTSAVSLSTSMPQLYPDYCHVLSPTIGKWCPMRAADVYDLKDVGMFCDGIRLFHYGNHPVKWVRLTGVIVAVDEFIGKEDTKTRGTGPGRMIYTLDDSSGACIECTAITPSKPPPKDLSLAPRHLDQLEALQAKQEETRKKKKEMAMKLAGYAKEEQNKKEDKKSEEKVQPSVMTPMIQWEDVDVGSVVKVKGRVGSFRDQKQVEIVKVEVLKSTDMEVRCWNEVREFREGILKKPWVVSKEEEENCRRKRDRDLKKIRRDNHGKRKERGTSTRKQRASDKENDKKGDGSKLKKREKVEDKMKDYDARDEVLRERRHHKNASIATTKVAVG